MFNKPQQTWDYDCNAVWRPWETLPLDMGQQLHGSPWQILATVVHSKHSGDMGVALWSYMILRCLTCFAMEWKNKLYTKQELSHWPGLLSTIRCAQQNIKASMMVFRCCFPLLLFKLFFFALWLSKLAWNITCQLLFPYQQVQQVRCLSSDPNSVHQEQAFWQASGPHKHSSYNDSYFVLIP